MGVMTDKKSGEVTFVFKGIPDAREVYLAGDFSHWTAGMKRMSRYRDGTFRTRVALKPGEYQYKFLADGVWVNDAEAPAQVPNPFGTLNSVIRVS